MSPESLGPSLIYIPSMSRDDSAEKLDKYLTKGDVVDGYRSRAKAKGLVPGLAKALALTEKEEATFSDALADFAVEVILGAAWYSRMYRHARLKAWTFIAINAALIIFLPLTVAMLGTRWSRIITDPTHYTSVVAQLSSVLTGILALQKTASAWYAQQQNYAEWYKSRATLKAIYFDFIQNWAERVSEDPNGFLKDLAVSLSKGREIMDLEREAFYTRLALPSFDALDMMTSTRTTVAALVSQLAPPQPIVDAGLSPIKKPPSVEKQDDQTRSAGCAEIKSQSDASVREDTLSLDDAQVGLVRQVRFLIPATPLPVFDQNVVASCAALRLSSAADVNALFGNFTSFFAWFNGTFKNVAAVGNRYPSTNTDLKCSRFNSFWDQIPSVFHESSITALEFCALMAISLEETNGDFAGEEGMNPLGSPHGGLAYAFDDITRVVNGKTQVVRQSYNRADNRTALSLFKDSVFLQAHQKEAGANAILARPGGVDPRWGGRIWPADVSPSFDPTINGFVREADFYKFRGRGIIQTTWRPNYVQLIEWILTKAPSTNPTVQSLATRWKQATPGLEGANQYQAIATISTNDDWHSAFNEGILMAQAVAIYSESHGAFLTSLSRDVAVLNGDRSIAGSFAYFAKYVNGGTYPDTVAAMAKALACGIAQSQNAASPQPQAHLVDA